MTDTLITRHFQPTERPRSNRQGRSKKQLKPVIEHDGRVWVARYEGRPGLFFGATKQEAQNNLQATQ
jgi:hypothetical protein